MSGLALTPERLSAAYICLRTFPPFSQWRLPTADEMEFRVIRDPRQHGHYSRYSRTEHHWIAISSSAVGHFNTLAWVMAHEMIHLKQAISKTETPNTAHNAEFRRYAASVCRRFGWDFKTFV